MLHGVTDNTLSVLKAMEQSEFNFHLTGSRFFGGARMDSDWDFFVQDSPEVRSWIEGHEFNKEFEGKNYYGDPNIAVVYRYRNSIHVQVVPDAFAKSFVQRALVKAEVLKSASKMEAKRIWTLGYKLLEAMSETTNSG